MTILTLSFIQLCRNCFTYTYPGLTKSGITLYTRDTLMQKGGLDPANCRMASRHPLSPVSTHHRHLDKGDRSVNGSIKSRRLFVMRHGERCDFAFGKSWLYKCFDEKGNYTQTDLNLPTTMVPRQSHKHFEKDSPLTELGRFQARATGDALNRAGVDIQHVYSSPSLRCVQTAQHVVDGMGNNARICIEPSAFEWFGWYKNAMPNWLSSSQLAENGFSINIQHKPFVPVAKLRLDETVSDYYDRCHKLAQHLLTQHEADGGDILVVAHAGSLDTFTRRLCGKLPRSSQEMHQILSYFTYCCLCCVAQDEKSGKWSLEEPPCPPLNEFNWKDLL